MRSRSCASVPCGSRATGTCRCSSHVRSRRPRRPISTSCVQSQPRLSSHIPSSTVDHAQQYPTSRQMSNISSIACPIFKHMDHTPSDPRRPRIRKSRTAIRPSGFARRNRITAVPRPSHDHAHALTPAAAASRRAEQSPEQAGRAARRSQSTQSRWRHRPSNRSRNIRNCRRTGR